MATKYILHDAHDLQYRVHFVLSNDPFIRGKDVCCEVMDEDVTLKGSVRSYYQKQMAQESLRNVPGIRRILNELSVVRG